MILKVVGCKDCVQENKLPLWGGWGRSPSRWAILAIFSKIVNLTPLGEPFQFLEQLEKAKLLRYGGV